MTLVVTSTLSSLLYYNLTNTVIPFNETNNVSSTQSTHDEGPPKSPYNFTQMVIIGVVATLLSLLTVIGNFMVMISFKIDKQLQTISNYFLFSLAIADFAIGLISMPLFTVSTIVSIPHPPNYRYMDQVSISIWAEKSNDTLFFE